jgi:hypothetical protein
MESFIAKWYKHQNPAFWDINARIKHKCSAGTVQRLDFFLYSDPAPTTENIDQSLETFFSYHVEMKSLRLCNSYSYLEK